MTVRVPASGKGADLDVSGAHDAHDVFALLCGLPQAPCQDRIPLLPYHL